MSVKKALANLAVTDVPGPRGLTSLSNATQYLATSVAKSFETKTLEIALPEPPTSLALAALGE